MPYSFPEEGSGGASSSGYRGGGGRGGFVPEGFDMYAPALMPDSDPMGLKPWNHLPGRGPGGVPGTPPPSPPPVTNRGVAGLAGRMGGMGPGMGGFAPEVPNGGVGSFVPPQIMRRMAAPTWGGAMGSMGAVGAGMTPGGPAAAAASSPWANYMPGNVGAVGGGLPGGGGYTGNVPGGGKFSLTPQEQMAISRSNTGAMPLFNSGGGGWGNPRAGGGYGGGTTPGGPANPSPPSPWAPDAIGGMPGPNYSSGGLYPGTPFVQYRGDQPGSISAINSYFNMLLGGGAGSMFDPTGNYAPYLEGLQNDMAGRTASMLDRNRLAASLSPNIDPSQRAYAGLLAESNATRGAQDVLSGARRGLAETNQDYMRQVLNQILQLQSGGQANPYVDWKMFTQNNQQQGNWYDPLLAGAGAVAGSWLSPGGIWGGAR